MARKKIPNPWHVVRVRPSIQDSQSPLPDAAGPQQGYRYDVIGHLRFGRHKLADGTYRSTVEYVRPHQRGLRHERYIPKVSRFDGGYEPHPRMAEWWGRDTEKMNPRVGAVED